MSDLTHQIEEGVSTPTNTQELVQVLNTLQKSLRAYAAKISGTPGWKSYSAEQTATNSPMARLDLMANHQEGDIVTMDRIRMDLRFWGEELVQTLEVSRLVRDLRFQQRADVKVEKKIWAAEDDLDPAKLTAASLLDSTKPFWAEVRNLKPKDMKEERDSVSGYLGDFKRMALGRRMPGLSEADMGKAIPGAEMGSKLTKGGAVMNPESRAALEKLLWKWMPGGNKGKVGGVKKFMATGDFAKKMKLDNYTLFTVADLSDEQAAAMMQYLKPKAESRIAEAAAKRDFKAVMADIEQTTSDISKKKLTVKAGKAKLDALWREMAVLQGALPESRLVEGTCAKCGGRLGAQNPGKVCDSCKLIQAQDKKKKNTRLAESDDAEIAKTIAMQMAGGVGKIKALLGATVMAAPSGLQIKWPNKKRSLGNICVVTLRPDDTYDMEFFNGAKSVKKFEGLYAEDLKRTFESHTGWFLSL